MASVPSIGCLLARNQYYRKASISSVSSLSGSDSVNVIPDDKSQQELPKVAESDWWFKSFFHSEPELSDVRRKDLSASRKTETCWSSHFPDRICRHPDSESLGSFLKTETTVQVASATWRLSRSVALKSNESSNVVTYMK
ncbi:pancreatic progenitor cell differentiation and proliferation factor-like protein isoform X1 [Neofelis nebulosa]|uniref:pancreatic progenitor cell differentiation and proliferation factor-like protein isoform X1 n=1 Tax=Neofelis nebulosa TaxID=61452 RepID=UPI00272CB35D|nr:pancreatic progenitor cell differentiation and proliferation factor-like protein isoform X1 [Neofelis nebulosa]